MTGVERFKAMFANAVERVCMLEAELELARQRIAELEAQEQQNGKVELEEVSP